MCHQQIFTEPLLDLVFVIDVVYKIEERIALPRELIFLRKPRHTNQPLQGSTIITMMEETPKIMGLKKEDLRLLGESGEAFLRR